MWFKKLTSSLLITSLITSQMIVASYAGETTPAKSPEFKFLKSVIALQGTNLTNDQYKARVQAAANTYITTARAEGQPDRMEGALIELGVYNPDQAKDFTANTQSLVTVLQQSGTVTADQFNAVVTGEAVQLAKLHSTGAEFSGAACAVIGIGALASLALFIGVIVVVTGGNNSFSSQDHPIAADIDIAALSAVGLGAVLGAIGCR